MDESLKNTKKGSRKRKVRPPRSRFKKPSAREETFKKKYSDFIDRKQEDQDALKSTQAGSSSNIKCNSSIPGLNFKWMMKRIKGQRKKSISKFNGKPVAVNSSGIQHWGEFEVRKPVDNYNYSASFEKLKKFEELKKISKFKANHALVSTLSSYFNFSNKKDQVSKSEPTKVEEKDYDFLNEPENNLLNIAKFKKQVAIEEILKSKILCPTTSTATEQGESNKQVKKRISKFFRKESLCTEHDDYLNRNENLLENSNIAINDMKISWDNNSDENTLIKFIDPATLISNRLNVIQTNKVKRKIYDKIRHKSSRYYDTRLLNLLKKSKKVCKSNFITHHHIDRKRRQDKSSISTISTNKSDTTSIRKSKKDDQIIKDRNKEKSSGKSESTKTNHCDSKKDKGKMKLKDFEDSKKRSQTSKNHNNESKSSCVKSTTSNSGNKEKNSQRNKERVTSRSRNKDFLSSLANQTEIKKSMEVLYFSLVKKGGETSHTATSTTSSQQQQQVSPFSLSFASQLQGIGNKSQQQQQQKGKTESSYSLSINEAKGHKVEEITVDKSISLNENLLQYNDIEKELIESVNQNAKDKNKNEHTTTKRKKKKKKKSKSKEKEKEKEREESATNNNSNIKNYEDEKSSKQNYETKNNVQKSSSDKPYVKKLLYPYPIWYPHSTPISTYQNIFANEKSASKINIYNKVRVITNSDNDCQPKIITFSRRKRAIVKSNNNKGSSSSISKMLNNSNNTPSQTKDKDHIKPGLINQSDDQMNLKSSPLKYTSVEILERKNQQQQSGPTVRPERINESANIELLRKKLLNQQIIQSQRNPTTKVKSAFLAQQQFNTSIPKKVSNLPLTNNIKEYIGKCMSGDVNNLYPNSMMGKLSTTTTESTNNNVNSDSPFKTILKNQDSYLSPSKSSSKKESPSKSVKILSPPNKDKDSHNNKISQVQFNRFTNKRRYQESDKIYLKKLLTKLSKELTKNKEKYRYCMRTDPIDQYKRIAHLLEQKRELEYKIKKASVDGVIFKDYDLLDTLNSIVDETETEESILENGLDLDNNTITIDDDDDDEEIQIIDIKKPKDTVLDNRSQLESNISSKSHKVKEKKKILTTIDKIRKNNSSNVSRRILEKYRKYAKRKSEEYDRVKIVRQKVLRKGDNKQIPKPDEEEYVFSNSIPMTNENTHETLQKRLCLPISCAGFTHVTPPALNALTLATEFFYKKLSSRLHQIVEEEMCSYNHGFPDAIERTLVEFGFGGVRDVVQDCDNFINVTEEKLNRRCVLLTKKYFDLTANENLIEISSPTKREPSVSPSKNKQQQQNDDVNSDDKKLKVIDKQSFKQNLKSYPPKNLKNTTLNEKDTILDEHKSKKRKLSSPLHFSFP